MIYWFHYEKNNNNFGSEMWDSKYKINTKEEQSILEMYVL